MQSVRYFCPILTKFGNTDKYLVALVNINFYNKLFSGCNMRRTNKGGYTLVTLPRTVTPYRDSVDGTRDHVTYQKLVTW
jgi:hypothetical protein